MVIKNIFFLPTGRHTKFKEIIAVQQANPEKIYPNTERPVKLMSFKIYGMVTLFGNIFNDTYFM